MPEAIGALAIDLAVDAAADFLSDAAIDAGVDFAAGTTLGIGNATLVGSSLLLAASIGLQYALSRPSAPKAEDGSQPIRAPIQPRQRGYWNNRLSGAVMLATTGGVAPTTAVMAAAFHAGPVDSIIGFYFDDDQVTMSTSLLSGGSSAVIGPGGAYASTTFSVSLGLPGQVADPNLTGSVVGSAHGLWTADFVGIGIAYWGMQCTAPGDPKALATLYPRGLPRPSVVANCARIWNPRDVTQSQDPDNSGLWFHPTWHARANPVLQLLDYLRVADGGMGFDIDDFCPPARLAQWMVEADLCDVDLGGGDIRYRCAFWYTFDTKPEDVINKFLAACDGWLAPAGDGTLALTVGVYRASTLPPITEGMIYDMQVSLGNPDESLVNQLDCTWTNPLENYSSDQSEPIQDRASVALVGAVKRQPLDLGSVQWLPQVVRLGERALRRVNPKRSGTLVGKDILLRYAGERWIDLQFPFPGLESCTIEVQDFQADILAGRVTIEFISIDPILATLDFRSTTATAYLFLLED